MQHLVKQHAIVNEKKVALSWLPYVILAMSTALTLTAIFGISAWVEASAWHHAVQHVVIFVSGAAAGGSALLLRKAKKDQ
jgi:hypothetical protein